MSSESLEQSILSNRALARLPLINQTFKHILLHQSMKHLFILGRNPELSIAELEAFCHIDKYERFKNAILAEANINNNTISHLGGTIALGSVLAQGKIQGILKQLDSLALTSTSSNKLNYVLWDFTNPDSDINEIKEYLKQRFKREKFKATEKHIHHTIKLESGNTTENIPSDSNIDEQYFLFQGKEFYFGKITQIYNAKEQEKRDMSKPVRREALALSPRLSKIMINLAQLKQNQIMLDPFCGIGVILQEALLQNIKVIGIDKDLKAIQGAKQNLEFAKFNKEDYQLITDDSTKVRIQNANALVTEPHLGEILKDIPKKQEAELMLRQFENLMIRVISNLNPKINSRIVFTAPLIKIREKKSERLECNIDKIAKSTYLKLVSKFQETREDQIVARSIFVLEKR